MRRRPASHSVNVESMQQHLARSTVYIHFLASDNGRWKLVHDPLVTVPDLHHAACKQSGVRRSSEAEHCTKTLATASGLRAVAKTCIYEVCKAGGRLSGDAARTSSPSSVQNIGDFVLKLACSVGTSLR